MMMNPHRFAAFGLIAMLAGTYGTAQSRSVQVGYCTPLINIDAAKAVGFEYVELSTSEIAGLSDADFEKAAAHVREVGLPAPVTNLFLPPALKVTGPDVDREQQMDYVRKAFARLERLGTQIVVFGSGGARRVPDGFPKDQAFQQLVEFGRRIAPEGTEALNYAFDVTPHELITAIITEAGVLEPAYTASIAAAFARRPAGPSEGT